MCARSRDHSCEKAHGPVHAHKVLGITLWFSFKLTLHTSASPWTNLKSFLLVWTPLSKAVHLQSDMVTFTKELGIKVPSFYSLYQSVDSWPSAVDYLLLAPACRPWVVIISISSLPLSGRMTAVNNVPRATVIWLLCLCHQYGKENDFFLLC